MDRSEEAVESVNPREQGLLASEPSENNVPNEPTEALLRISHAELGASHLYSTLMSCINSFMNLLHNCHTVWER